MAFFQGETDLIVPPQDAQVLAAAIMQLLSDPEEAQAMAQAVRRHVEMHYSAWKRAEE